MGRGGNQGIKEGNTIATIVEKKDMVCIIAPILETMVMLLSDANRSHLLERDHK